jgi:hypothetical protein
VRWWAAVERLPPEEWCDGVRWRLRVDVPPWLGAVEPLLGLVLAVVGEPLLPDAGEAVTGVEGAVTGVVVVGGTCVLGGGMAGVETVMAGTAGVVSVIGVGVGTETVTGGSAGVVSVTLGRSGSSAAALAGRAARTTSPAIPTTAIRRLLTFAPLSNWLPIRHLSAYAKESFSTTLTG